MKRRRGIGYIKPPGQLQFINTFSVFRSKTSVKMFSITSYFFCFSLLTASAVMGQTSPSFEERVITVTNGGLEGKWGPLERCPPGSRAVSFRTRNELATPLFDDTALNTIVIYCNDELATNFTSTPGR
jgi:hypothetical protein